LQGITNCNYRYLYSAANILEIINEGSSENIDWLALYDYEASSDSSVTIYLSGTVLVKRVVE
jgi:hypothetical protein